VVPDALRTAVDELGEDHLLMATDYPHFDSEYAHTVAKIKVNNLLTPVQKEKILGENTRALLKIYGWNISPSAVPPDPYVTGQTLPHT
jgi:predicted TIM-barrel fold metal-dependent hydrolase